MLLQSIGQEPFLTPALHHPPEGLLTWPNLNRITPLNRCSLYSLTFQNALSINALKLSVLSVEVAEEVLQAVTVSVLGFVTKSEAFLIACAPKRSKRFIRQGIIN